MGSRQPMCLRASLSAQPVIQAGKHKQQGHNFLEGHSKNRMKKRARGGWVWGGTREWENTSTGECGTELCIMQENGCRNMLRLTVGTQDTHTHTHRLPDACSHCSALGLKAHPMNRVPNETSHHHHHNHYHHAGCSRWVSGDVASHPRFSTIEQQHTFSMALVHVALNWPRGGWVGSEIETDKETDSCCTTTRLL